MLFFIAKTCDDHVSGVITTDQNATGDCEKYCPTHTPTSSQAGAKEQDKAF